jgi:CYTH domain-containing protein
MDKATRIELRRTFLIEDLPEPLTRAAEHLQFFDDYISNTRMRLRSVRDPATKKWTRVLQQREASPDGRVMQYAEIFLNDAEYGRFELFEGTEIRKNRYFFDLDGRRYELDVYLWPLWGLNTALTYFENEDEMNAFEPPEFLVREITNNSFYFGENLVTKSMDDVKAEIGQN